MSVTSTPILKPSSPPVVSEAVVVPGSVALVVDPVLSVPVDPVVPVVVPVVPAVPAVPDPSPVVAIEPVDDSPEDVAEVLAPSSPHPAKISARTDTEATSEGRGHTFIGDSSGRLCTHPLVTRAPNDV
jgi:hypothetical protein